MAKLKYKTQAVNTEIDPSGGYICRVVNADPVEDDAVFQEVIDALRLTESVFGLKKAMEAVIDTAMRKTASDGVPRKVGGLFRTYISIRGKVPNADSPFTALAGRGAGAYVRWGLSSEVLRKVDYNAVSISNVQGAQSVAVSSIAYNGAEENAFDIRRGVPILVTGRNVAYIDGDTVAVGRTSGGAETVLALLTPEESDYYHELFAWPEALDAVEDGAELWFRFSLRGGDPEATPVTVRKGVTLKAGAEPAPTPTPAPTLTDVFTREDEPGTIMQDEAFQLIGTNLTLGESGKVEAQLSDTESPETWYDLTANASNLDAERIRLSDLAWNTLMDQVGVGTEHSQVRFRVTIGGRSAEIVATAAIA